MNGNPDTGPALLSAALAELASRLRQAASAGCATGSPAWPNRLTAAARCWDRVRAETARDDFAPLAAALAELAAALAAATSADADLPGRLHALDAGLTRLLRRFDAGAVAGDLVADAGWATLAGAIRGEHPGPIRADEAHRRTGAGDTVGLLVTSTFLRDILSARLADAGCRVLPLDAPHEAPGLLQAAEPPRVVVCDNEEPTNNLRRLRELLGPGPFLVLVGAADDAPDRARRAQSLGADAVWPEPWTPTRLPRQRSARGTP